MRVLKNWLRTATATPRLSNLNVLYFHSDADFNTRQITVDFLTKYGRDGTDLFQSYLDRKKEQMEANVQQKSLFEEALDKENTLQDHFCTLPSNDVSEPEASNDFSWKDWMEEEAEEDEKHFCY